MTHYAYISEYIEIIPAPKPTFNLNTRHLYYELYDMMYNNAEKNPNNQFINTRTAAISGSAVCFYYVSFFSFLKKKKFTSLFCRRHWWWCCCARIPWFILFYETTLFCMDVEWRSLLNGNNECTAPSAQIAFKENTLERFFCVIVTIAHSCFKHSKWLGFVWAKKIMVPFTFFLKDSESSTVVPRFEILLMKMEKELEMSLFREMYVDLVFGFDANWSWIVGWRMADWMDRFAIL